MDHFELYNIVWEGGGDSDLFLWAQILIIDLQYLCFAAGLVFSDSGNAIVESFLSQWH